MRAAVKTAEGVLAPGTVVEGYTVERELHGHDAPELRYAVTGPGGFRGTLVASPARFEDRGERARFRRRAARRAALGHPAAVRVHAIAEVDGRGALITDAYPDVTFADLLEDESPLDPDRVIALLAPVAEALDLANAGGLAHRDLCGDSLLLADNDRLLLDSFGLLADEDAPARSVAEARSRRYRPPEQSAGDSLGRTANVYSLAALIVHALRGAGPYEGERRTVLYSAEEATPARGSELLTRLAHVVTQSPRFMPGQAVLNPRVTPVPVQVSDRMPHLGNEIDGVVARGMAADPAERHDSCTALIGDVAAALGIRAPDAAAAPVGPPRLHLVTERTRPRLAVVAAPPRPDRRLVAATGIAIALACGAVGALAANPFGGDPPDAKPARAATPPAWSAVEAQRPALRDQLAAARTPNEQAAAARGLAGLYFAAARARGPRSARVAAGEAGSAYARFAAAAENGDASGYSDAAAAIDRAEGRLGSAASGR
jgi:Protein kinase domain